MMTGWYFILNGRDFFCWHVDILVWTVEIFMMTGRDFIIYHTFMMTGQDVFMNGRDFHDDRLKFYYDWSKFS